MVVQCLAYKLTNHSYRSDTRGDSLKISHIVQLRGSDLWVLCKHFPHPLLWSPSTLTTAEYSKLVSRRRRRRTNQLRTKWGAVPPCHHKTEVITSVFHDWQTQPVLPIYPQCGSWEDWEGGFQQMLNYQAGCWRQFPLLGRVWEKFSLVWHFILQNYSTLRLRDKPWFMTD